MLARLSFTTEEDELMGPADRGPAYRRWLAGRTVAVVGLGRSGVAAARLVRRVGGRVLASDAAAGEHVLAAARALADVGCQVWTGGHPDAAFAGADLVVVSPGVPLTQPALARPRAAGLPIIGELELAWRAMQAEFVAITGTNGKTTTTALAGELLAGQARAVLVGGNIGTPLAARAVDFAPDGVVVAETSSFQLETTSLFAPRVAVVLNVTPDHLDRHERFERYVDAKARILAHQTAADWAVLNADDPAAASLAPRVRGRLVWFSRRTAPRPGIFVDGDAIVADLGRGAERICPLAAIPLRGQHNVENALAAAACALWAGVSPEAIRVRLAAFRPVAHRIEPVGQADGVAYYNDSKGTNVASTVVALRSFTEPVVLIAGGTGKGQDFTPLAAAARGRVQRCVLIGVDRDRLRGPLRAEGIPTEDAADMIDAVRRARAAARPGDVVLLSPACASFDMFDNYEHRGEAFRAAVGEVVR